MTEKANKRSGMLGAIYQMLPNIDDDYAAKLVYTLESKKSVPSLQQDIADICAKLGDANAQTDTIAAKILLDEITLPAALRQLRVYNNALSITELTAALDTPAEVTDLLLNYYASFGSRRFFDVEFARALKDVRDKQDMQDADKAQYALDRLILQAQQDLQHNAQIRAQNRKDIYAAADQYVLPLRLTANLLNAYDAPGAENFKPDFEALFQDLRKINDRAPLCASLAAKAMLCQITQKDARDIALTDKLLKGQILEEDLMIIACRYLKVKTPQDIQDTFEAVLSRLPHVNQKEENLGLAVQVLLDGTEPAFEKAREKASLRRERILLRNALAAKEMYGGYEYDLAQRFGGRKTFGQLDREMTQLLARLPHCQDVMENKELACKVMLGSLSEQEAQKQASYLRDIKANTLTQGLASGALTNYLGTQPVEKLTAFFEKALSPYTFWKSDRAKHEFALSVLVDELNGTSESRISSFALDMLEEGASPEMVKDILASIHSRKKQGTDLEKLLETYKKAQVTGKKA